MSLKLWFRAGAIAVIALALSITIAVAQDYGHGHDNHDRDDDRHYDRDHGHDEGHEHELVRAHYHDHDREIHDWYRAHYSHLPPGLARHDRLPPELERHLVVNGFLPVELRARMQPCPHELEVILPPSPPGYRHVFIGGNLVLVNRVNFQVADVFHFDATF